MKPSVFGIVLLCASTMGCASDEVLEPSPRAMQIYSPNDTLLIGDTVVMTAVSVRANGDLVALDSVEWSSSDNGVAKVEGNGRVVGLREGSVIIKASLGERMATRNVVVNAWGPPRAIRGHYSFGFEASSFVECGSVEAYWAPWRSEVNEFVKDKPEYFQSSWGSSIAQGVVYVEWTARKSRAGQYGHVGAYRFELDVVSVEEVRAAGENDCSS